MCGLIVQSAIVLKSISDCLSDVKSTSITQAVEEVSGVSPLEHLLGDFRPGRWAWALASPRALPVPFPWPGALGLFHVPD